MKKSIYSLVLMDDVVEAVDAMAYRLHTSRSNLINQILAEHLSCVTPEMRMQAVFSGVEARMEEQFRILEQTSQHMLSLQTQLNYKYKPTVQYFVELYRAPEGGEAGRLRVQLRTQSQALLSVLEAFFRLWMTLEERYVPAAAGTQYRITPGRLERSIRAADVTEEELGTMIGAYVERFDRYLKAWLAGQSDRQGTAVRIESAFRQEVQGAQTSI